MKIIVQNENLDNIRIDKYLANNTEISRSQINKMFDQKLVYVNNNISKASYKVKENDLIEFSEELLIESPIEKQKIDINVVYEDEYLMVINKPSGLVVHPGNGRRDNTLVNGLMYYTSNLSNIAGDSRLGVVHRIDKDTSGLLVVAKDNKTHQLLSDMFKYKKIKRKYIALIDGVFPNQSATIDAPIGRDTNNRKQMMVTDNNSKNAITHFKVLKRYKNHTLIELLLDTGRTHQIRVHLKYIGFPIHNDPIYNSKKATEFGQFLHSQSVDFIHPITNENISVSCEIPEEFADYINSLE